MAGKHSDTLDRVSLDKWRSARIPGRKPATPIRIGRHQPVAKNPGRFDVFRVRTYDAADRGRVLTKAQQKSIIDIGKAKSLSFTAAVVHEDLE